MFVKFSKNTYSFVEEKIFAKNKHLTERIVYSLSNWLLLALYMGSSAIAFANSAIKATVHIALLMCLKGALL